MRLPCNFCSLEIESKARVIYLKFQNALAARDHAEIKRLSVNRNYINKLTEQFKEQQLAGVEYYTSETSIQACHLISCFRDCQSLTLRFIVKTSRVDEDIAVLSVSNQREFKPRPFNCTVDISYDGFMFKLNQISIDKDIDDVVMLEYNNLAQ